MARETKTITVVQCTKLDAELPALPKPPLPGEVGRRIYEEISAYAWDMWQEQATLIINHYGLNMADPRTQELMMQQMEAFLFGEEEGGGQPAIGGAPRKK